jgi:osmotically-inducible protein OsmY
MADETINDASISAAVQAKLTSDRVSNFLHVDVNAKRGIVTLSGIVESTAQRDQAERLARQVKGVLRVHNTLQIQSHSPGGIPTQPNYTHDTKSN